MENDTKFLEAEGVCRNAFYVSLSGTCKVEFTTDPYDKVDGFMTGASPDKKIYVFELKNRDIPVSKYEKEGYILEKNKYDALTSYADRIPLYVNLFRDKILAWDLSKINPCWEKRWCTSTTVQNYGHRVEKEVCLLQGKDAIWKQSR